MQCMSCGSRLVRLSGMKLADRYGTRLPVPEHLPLTQGAMESCKFNMSFVVLAKHAFVFSKAKLSLRMVALLHSPLDTFLILSLQASHLLLPTKSYTY